MRVFTTTKTTSSDLRRKKKPPTADKNLYIKRITSTSSLRQLFLQCCVLTSERPTQKSKPINLIEIKNIAINYNWWNTNCFSPHIRALGHGKRYTWGMPIIFRAANNFYWIIDCFLKMWRRRRWIEKKQQQLNRHTEIDVWYANSVNLAVCRWKFFAKHIAFQTKCKHFSLLILSETHFCICCCWNTKMPIILASDEPSSHSDCMFLKSQVHFDYMFARVRTKYNHWNHCVNQFGLKQPMACPRQVVFKSV